MECAGSEFSGPLPIPILSQFACTQTNRQHPAYSGEQCILFAVRYYVYAYSYWSRVSISVVVFVNNVLLGSKQKYKWHTCYIFSSLYRRHTQVHIMFIWRGSIHNYFVFGGTIVNVSNVYPSTAKYTITQSSLTWLPDVEEPFSIEKWQYNDLRWGLLYVCWSTLLVGQFPALQKELCHTNQMEGIYSAYVY